MQPRSDNSDKGLIPVQEAPMAQSWEMRENVLRARTLDRIVETPTGLKLHVRGLINISPERRSDWEVSVHIAGDGSSFGSLCTARSSPYYTPPEDEAMQAASDAAEKLVEIAKVITQNVPVQDYRPKYGR